MYVGVFIQLHLMNQYVCTQVMMKCTYVDYTAVVKGVVWYITASKKFVGFITTKQIFA